MTQIKGIRAILSHPKVYLAFQNLMGAPTIRRNFVKNFIKSFLDMRILDIGCGKEYSTLVEAIFKLFRIEIQHRNWIPYTHCFMECTAL